MHSGRQPSWGLLISMNRILASFQGPNKTWYYPRTVRPLLRHGAHGGIRHEFEAKRTWRFPAVAAAEADAEGSRPAGGPAAAYARPAAGGGGRTRRHRRRLVRPPRAGTIRQPVGCDDRRVGARVAADQSRTPASDGADAKCRPAPLRPRDRSAGDPAHGRTAQFAGLCHRTTLGHSR